MNMVKDCAFGFACALNFIVYTELLSHWFGVASP